MADNVGYTPGSGATVAADDIGGVLHQRVKLTLGADNTSDGDVSASNPMPIAGSVGVAGTVDVIATTPLDVAVQGTVPVTISGVSESNPLPVHDEDNHAMTTRVLHALESPRGYDKSLQRQRGTVIVESGTVTTVSTVTTVTTVTTVGTVTGLTNIDGIQGRIQVYGANLSAWADCVRARIS